jgi:hypothetical protein
MTSNKDIWLKKSDLYGNKLIKLLRRNDFDNSLTSSFRLDDFLFDNQNDSNRKEMEAYLKGADTRTILNKMIDIKRDMKAERGHINRYLQEMNLSKYRGYKSSPSADIHIPIRNIDTKGDLIKDSSTLPKIKSPDNSNDNYRALSDLITSGYQTLPSPNKTTYNKNSSDPSIKNKAIIRKSIECQFYWKNTDITQHAIGTPTDLAKLAGIIIDQGKETLGANKRLDFLNIIFYPHLDPKDHGAFSSGVSSITAFISENRYPNLEDEDKGLKEAGKIPKLEEIYTILNDNKSSTNSKAKEFLIIYLIDIFQNINRVYQEISKLLRRLKSSDTALHLSLDKSRKSLIMFLNNTIKNFFNLDSLYTPYGFAKTRETKSNPAESANKSGFFRIIGDIDVAKDLSKFEASNYPVSIAKSDDYKLEYENTVQRFQDMFLGKHNSLNDAKTGNPIYMGGFIMKAPYDDLSIRILSGAFNRMSKAKDKRIAIADKIINGSKEYLNVNDLVQIKNELFTDLDNVASYGSAPLRNIAFKTVMDEIIRKYIKYRDQEIQDLVATVKFSSLLRKYDISNPSNAKEVQRVLEVENSQSENLVDEILKAKETLMVKLNYHQLMAVAYRVISLRIISLINAERGEQYMPISYFNTMKSAFQRADLAILNKVSQMKIGEIATLKNKIKATLNTPDIGLDDLGINVNGSRRGRVGKPRNSSNNNFGLGLDLMAMENSGEKDFWDNLSTKLRGYSIYIPYVEGGFGNSYGLFNLTSAALDGKINTDQFISEFYLTESKYTDSIRPSSYILVSDKTTDLRKPVNWKVIPRKDLNGASKLSSKDLRMFLYNLLFSQAVYNRRVNQAWSNNSKSKVNLVKYCSKIVSERTTCPVLISRERLGGFE